MAGLLCASDKLVNYPEIKVALKVTEDRTPIFSTNLSFGK